MSAPPFKKTLGVNNILSFNGHGGKDLGKPFTLPANVYVLVPFGLGVELPVGSKPLKTDESHKGLDVCYGFPKPEAKNENEQSFEDIIYSKDGKLKLTFNKDVDAKWYLYKPGQDVPNVSYYPWKDGDNAAAAAKCNVVSKNYDDFVKDLMNQCLASSNGLNNKVCAYFVSDSTQTKKDNASGKTTSAVFIDKDNNRHLKLKICGDDPNVVTTTLKELAENCRDLVKFSKEFVLKNNETNQTYDGYTDENIFPKSGTDDPIILLPFSCNSCGPTDNITLSHTNHGDTSVKSLSDIIAELAGGADGGAGSSDSSGDPPSGKVAQFFMTFEKVSNDGGLKSDEQAQKIVNVVKCLMSKKYKHIGLTYSANQDQTNEVFSYYNYDKSLSDNKFADGEEKVISSQILGGTNQANVLTKLNDIIKNNPSYSDFKKAFRVIPFTTMRYVAKVKHDLDTLAPGNNRECSEAAKKFLELEDSIILGWCNQDSDKLPNKTGKKTFAIGGGEASKLQNANDLYIHQYLKFLETEWNEEVQKIVNICNTNHASVDAGASSTSPPSKVAPSKPLDDIIKDLIAGIKNTEDTEATLSALSIKEPPGGLVYKYTSSDASPPPSSASTPPPPPVKEDKNLNSADPDIKKMIEDFETAVDEADKNFYLGACGSIKAAYELDMSLAGSDDNKKTRAKLLLNLRKNSLLLKVPARWDYKEMKMGKVKAPPTEINALMSYSLQDTIEYYSQDGGATQDEKGRFAVLNIQKDPTEAVVGSTNISGIDGRFVKGIDAEMDQSCFFVSALQLLFCDEVFLQLIIIISCQPDDYISSINSNNGDVCNIQIIVTLDDKVNNPLPQPEPKEKSDTERGKEVLSQLVKLFKAYINGTKIENNLMKSLYDTLGLRYAKQQDSGEVITKITGALGCLDNIYVKKYFSNSFLELKKTTTTPKHSDFNDQPAETKNLIDKLIMIKTETNATSVSQLFNDYLNQKEDFEFMKGFIKNTSTRKKLFDIFIQSSKNNCEICDEFVNFSENASNNVEVNSFFQGYDDKSEDYTTEKTITKKEGKVYRKQSELKITLLAIKEAIKNASKNEETCRMIIEDIKYVILNPMVKEGDSSKYTNLKKISEMSVIKYSEYIFININRTLEGNQKNTINVDISRILNISSSIYTLVGYVFHEGSSSSSGHFVCVKCDNNGDPKVEISDSSVKKWTEKYSNIIEWETGVFLLIYKKKQSQSGGGFKPTHNTTATHTTSTPKSKHNSSFKVSSSSKSKHKGHNRSHTQRVK